MVLDVDNRESISGEGRSRNAFRDETARRLAMGLYLAGLALAAAGCASVPRHRVADTLQPSNDRPWKSNLAVLPYARIRGERVKVYNVRNCTYLDEETYVVNHEDRTYDLRDLESLDFIICPFGAAQALAHTMLSFGFRDGQYLSLSVEARLEEGESYSPLAGALRQYEIMYVIADERDVIKLRTDVRDADVYIYRTRANPEQVRQLFVDVMMRANTLKRHPEFYDTLMNNCTTNIVAHVNRAVPGAIAWDPTSPLTGYSDRMAYHLGLLVDYGGFEETKGRAHINSLARRYADDERFSERIRSGQMTARWADRSSGTPIR